MSWFGYYALLEKYHGDLSQATESQLRLAAKMARGNSIGAREEARTKYAERIQNESSKQANEQQAVVHSLST